MAGGFMQNNEIAGSSDMCPHAAHLVILIRGHRHEVGLREHVGPERGVGELQDVVGPHDVEPGLVLVHGVQDSLETGGGEEARALTFVRICYCICILM